MFFIIIMVIGNKYKSFGHSIDISGDYLIVGAPYMYYPENYGYAYIYQNNLGTWEEIKKLSATDNNSDDFFGSSVAINNNYAVVGSARHDYDINSENFIENTGALYIYTNNGNLWNDSMKTTASKRVNYAEFGTSIKMDGDYVFSGAPYEVNNRGAVFVYTQTPTVAITSHPENVLNLCYEETITFSVITENADSFKWQYKSSTSNVYADVTDNATYSGSNTATLTVNANININNTFFRCVVSSQYESVTSGIALIQYEDIPPTITSLHDDIFINADNNCNTILENYTSEVTMTDNCSDIITITQSPDAGIEITGETNQILLLVSDYAGNTSSISFNIEVVDDINPTISCAENVTLNITSEEIFYTVLDNEFDPLKTDDNCEIAEVSNNINSYATLSGEEIPIGENYIIWTVTDVSGNYINCTQIITVNSRASIRNLNSQIIISPNPARNYVKINNINQINEIKITDITGKTVFVTQNKLRMKNIVA